MAVSDIPRTIWWGENEDTGQPAVFLIDQTRLPLQGDVLACNTYDGVCVAIKTLAVRGAPALGVAAALAVALWSETEGAEIDNVDDYLFRMSEVIAEIVSTRPTAVNLFWGAARMRSIALGNSDLGIEDLRALVLQEALNMVERGRGAQPQAGRARGRASRRELEGTHPLQRRIACYGVLRHGARCHLHRVRAGQDRARLGRRDASRQPGRAPHRVGAAGRGHSLGADHRQHGRECHEERVGGRGHRRRGPHLRERRHGQQDRHLRACRARQGARHPVLRCGAQLDRGPDHRRRLADRDRGARSS